MSHDAPFEPDAFGAATHLVFNQPAAFADVNLFTGDRALREAVAREDADWAQDGLSALGARLGSRAHLALGDEANWHAPELDTHDRAGNRVDHVRYHPAYHALMASALGEGLHSAPWTDPRLGAHVARAAAFYMDYQTEAGHCCPVTMSFAATPVLAQAPSLAALWLPKLHARDYDPANAPIESKRAVTIGMAMTEKQGGSDVRANTTRATPLDGDAYALVGHKYFVSAPMSDAFLVLAQAPDGLTCFLAPRWRPDGTKNPIQIQRLKRKSANVSNASAETELRGALAWRIGEEGRGVRVIIDMVALTRFDCMIGSAAGMRMATAQAIDHCAQREAFGRRLIDQPLMTNVLADLALESEAALVMTMRLARALDAQETHLARLLTALGKYWICKRAPAHAAEAMECVGGSGVMQESMMQRLYREAPINAIWEGSGNIQCLDILRAVTKEPATLAAILEEIGAAKGADARLDRAALALRRDIEKTGDFERRGRDLVDRLATAFQAACLVRANAPDAVIDAFVATRVVGEGAHLYGALPQGARAQEIVRRAAGR